MNLPTTDIDWDPYRSIVVLTGAGISVASGLRPYRGPGGLWSEIDVDSVVTAAADRHHVLDVAARLDAATSLAAI